jgi:hypothetical protein
VTEALAVKHLSVEQVKWAHVPPVTPTPFCWEVLNIRRGLSQPERSEQKPRQGGIIVRKYGPQVLNEHSRFASERGRRVTVEVHQMAIRRL